MNIIEQRFMESVPSTLHDIAKSLETIACKKQATEPAEIWVLFAESLCDYEFIGRYIHVFTSEDAARKEFKRYVDTSRKTAKSNGWKIGADNDDFFEAYPEGEWDTSHETIDLQKTLLNSRIYCNT